ncbi:thioredoxin family protein, partial [Candidatus Micrarchaeota archaeon]|nr:thioredoxin family protein [Candidatus Micrarchaeota archaeon]
MVEVQLQSKPIDFPIFQRTHGKVYAVLINGDTSSVFGTSPEDHMRNVQLARDAILSRGVAPPNIFVLGDAKKNQSSESRVKGIFDELSKKVTVDDLVIVYYTGHGGLEKGRPTFVFEKKQVDYGRFLDYVAGVKKAETVFVMDQCYSGGLPAKILEKGFNAEAMAPVIEGVTSACQFFAPYFWQAVKQGKDLNQNKTTSFSECFAYAITIYNDKTGEKISGAYAKAPVELTIKNYQKALEGKAIIDLYAPWCENCRELEQGLQQTAKVYGEDVAIYRINMDRKEESKFILAKLGIIPSGGIPELFFIEGEKGNRKVIYNHVGYTPFRELSDLISSKFMIKNAKQQIIEKMVDDLTSLD